MTDKMIELPQLALEVKWATAESNLIYFIVCGIAYAKAKGDSAADYGTFAGKIANWDDAKGRGPRALVEGISSNKQQFRNFQMEILSESPTAIRARMKGFGEDAIRKRKRSDVTVDDYIRFFEKKWQAIAEGLGLQYRQETEGDWVVFTVTT
jgi:hypothetical protein